MKGKSGKGPPSTDLLVCFPTRAHLTLMPPKSINSPIRPPSESSSHHHNHHHQKQPLQGLPSRHHRRGRSFGVGQSSSSPTLWSKNKPNNNDISEPTSPKVTCAGQIKVRPKSNGSSCKNWQSVMEQIERIQNTKKQKKKPNWVESLGLKKDVMQFLTCMRNIRFDFRCFGAFPTTAISSDDEDDEEDEDEDDHINNVDHQEKQHGGLPQFRNTGGVGEEEDEDDKSSKTYFSKWYMVLQDDTKKEKTFESYRKSTSDEIIAPPQNALLLMRCRSAPPKSWLEERDEEEEEKKKVEVKTEEAAAMDDHKIEKTENMILRYGAGEHDLYKFSSDIAKETWVVGGIKASLSRSRSWKS